MKRIIVAILVCMACYASGQVRLNQLQKAPDSTYIIGAKADGEGVWKKQTVAKPDSLFLKIDTLKLRDGSGFVKIGQKIEIEVSGGFSSGLTFTPRYNFRTTNNPLRTDNSYDASILIDDSAANELGAIYVYGNDLYYQPCGGCNTDYVATIDGSSTNELGVLRVSNDSLYYRPCPTCTEVFVKKFLSSFTETAQTISTTGAAGNISISGANTLNLNVNDADASVTNETITAIGKAANNVTITEAGVARTFSVADGDSSKTNETITDVSRSGTDVTITEAGTGHTFSIADNDNNPSNELQNLTLSGNTLGLTQSVVTVNLPIQDTISLSNRINAVSNTIATHRTNDQDTVIGNEGLMSLSGSASPYTYNSNTSGSTPMILSESARVGIARSFNNLTFDIKSGSITPTLLDRAYLTSFTEVDGSVLNEIQNPTLSGYTLGLTQSGVTVKIPSLVPWDSVTNKPTIVGNVTATSPLFRSGGLNPNITIQNAATNATGALTSTDWNRFNQKQNAFSGTYQYLSKFNILGKNIENSLLYQNSNNVFLQGSKAFTTIKGDGGIDISTNLVADTIGITFNKGYINGSLYNRTMSRITSSTTTGFNGATFNFDVYPIGTGSNLVTPLRLNSDGAQFPLGLYTTNGGGSGSGIVPNYANNGYSFIELPKMSTNAGGGSAFLKFPNVNFGNNNSRSWIGVDYNGNFSSKLNFYAARIGNVAHGEANSRLFMVGKDTGTKGHTNLIGSADVGNSAGGGISETFKVFGDVAITNRAGTAINRLGVDVSGRLVDIAGLGTNYTAGAGLSLVGSKFSNTGDLSTSNELQTTGVSGFKIGNYNNAGFLYGLGTEIGVDGIIQRSAVASTNGGAINLSIGNGTITPAKLDRAYLTSFTEVDGSVSNETITSISKSGNNITIVEAGVSRTFTIADADSSRFNELITDVNKVGTDVTITEAGTGHTFSIADNDNDATNERGVLRVSNDSMYYKPCAICIEVYIARSKGDQGIQGVQGIPGIQGIQGFTGSTGAQGIQGESGLLTATDSPTIDFTYNSGTKDITGFVKDGSITPAKLNQTYLTSFTEVDGSNTNELQTTGVSGFRIGNYNNAGFLYGLGTEIGVDGIIQRSSVASTNGGAINLSIGNGTITDNKLVSTFLKTETDPTVGAHIKGITTGDISNWNASHLQTTGMTSGFRIANYLNGFQYGTGVEMQAGAGLTRSASTSSDGGAINYSIPNGGVTDAMLQSTFLKTESQTLTYSGNTSTITGQAAQTVPNVYTSSGVTTSNRNITTGNFDFGLRTSGTVFTKATDRKFLYMDAENTVNGGLWLSGGLNSEIMLRDAGVRIMSGGSYGSTGQVLTSNASGNVYWSTPSTGSTYTAGAGISINGSNVISNTGDLSSVNEIDRLGVTSSGALMNYTQGFPNGVGTTFNAGQGLQRSWTSSTDGGQFTYSIGNGAVTPTMLDRTYLTSSSYLGNWTYPNTSVTLNSGLVQMSGTVQITPNATPTRIAGLSANNTVGELTLGSGLSITGGQLTVSSTSTPVNIQEFNYTGSTQTWIKPSGAREIEVIIIGGGGGGGGSKYQGFGGQGGGGGGVTILRIPASTVSNETVYVGVGGSGGNGDDGSNNGSNGLDGDVSWFSSSVTLYASGGIGGQRGESTASSSNGDGGLGDRYDGGKGGTSNQTAAQAKACLGGSGGRTAPASGTNSSTIAATTRLFGTKYWFTGLAGYGGTNGFSSGRGGNGSIGCGGGGGGGLNSSNFTGFPAGSGGRGGNGKVIVITY